MKKHLLFTILSFFFTFNIIAQDEIALANPIVNEECCAEEKDTPPKLDDEMKAMINKELQLFTEYLAAEIEYPERPRKYNVEGTMIVRVTFNGEIKKLKILQSVNSECDELVLKKIKEYASSFDTSAYAKIPMLTFDLPIKFRML